MKRTLTAITAAIFAGAMALPAFAQVGAGIAGNANVGKQSMSAGANADVNNDDAERTEPNAPVSSAPRHAPRPDVYTNPSNNPATGASAGVGANVGGSGAHLGARVNPGTDNSPTGGY
jgi:hypothetical protein